MTKNLCTLIEKAKTCGNDNDEPVLSTELLGGKDRLIIEHGSQVYQLLTTGQGELILTANTNS